MQEFFIRKNSINPQLRMELVNNGRYNFNDFYEAIQDSTISFSMVDVNSGIKKIINNKANIEFVGGCDGKFIIYYQWVDRDVKTPGIFKGHFDITFNGDISKKDTNYPKGLLRVPIKEDLIIHILE